jgi:hypothetical protein
MRSVEQYMEKAAEFDKLTKEVSEPVLKKRYADIAECYRLLANDLKRLIATGVFESNLIRHPETPRPALSGFDPDGAPDQPQHPHDP